MHDSIYLVFLPKKREGGGRKKKTVSEKEK